MHLTKPFFIAGLLASTTALAGGKKDVAKALETYLDLNNAHDEAVLALYTAGANMLIRSTDPYGQVVDATMTGAQLQAMGPQIMETARQTGDKMSFQDVSIKPDDGGFRVTATRMVENKCYADTDWNSLWRKQDDGQWRIVEEHLTAAFYSQCEDAPSKASQLITAMVSSVHGQLPLQVAEDLFINKLEGEGETITFTFRNPQAVLAELDVDAFVTRVSQTGKQAMCADPKNQTLFDEGGTMFQIFVDGEGEEITRLEWSAQTCQ